MKAIKIYGIRGLLEWHGILTSNGVKMKVDFTNGSVTAYGVAPATLMTKDDLTQHIIENSDQFKSGRIHIEKVIPLPGEEKEDATNATEPEAAPASPIEGAPLKVEVSDKMAAVEYLKEHFAEKEYTSVKLRTKSAFDAACKECGVEFVYPL